MANSSSNTLIEDSIQVALDAADTATGVAEEFNSLREQFEVQNIQAKRIYQSVSIIFVSSIAAAVICAAVGALIYFKTLSTLETNTNMAIESLAIFSENVGSLAKSVKTVEDNTANQELIKATLVTLEAAALKASEDVAGADMRYNRAIKLGIQETERVIQEFANNTLADLEAQALASQTELSEQIAQIKAIFTPEVSEDTEGSEDVTPNDNIVKASQIEALELKLDEIILLQKEVTAKILEQARKVEVQQAQAKKAPAKSKKPAANPPEVSMSEDLVDENGAIIDQNFESTFQDEVEDFDQGNLLLKIATNGLSIPDYVKKLKEADILVAVDGEVYRDGPANLKERFSRQNGQQSKWLLSLWRDGQIFDILITMPIESRFGLATEEETEWAMEEYNKHVYGDFDSYENYEIYKDVNGICDVLSMEKDVLAGLFPALWLLKYRLYPPLGAVLISYGVSYSINFLLFIITYIVLSRFIYVSQNNIMRSFTLFANKKHYMTIAGTNERDVSVIVKNIDPNNKIRFERHAVKKPKVVHKVIVKDNRSKT